MPSSQATTQTEDNLESYQRRLICAVTGRFVLIERTDAQESEGLLASAGKPCPSVRYRWRYWDNDGNVYDDAGEKYRAEFHPDHEFESNGLLPGDFRKGYITWMRFSRQDFDPFPFGTAAANSVRLREGHTLQTAVGSFWDCIWTWKYEGSTGCPAWDERLNLLAKTADTKLSDSSSWPLQESELDTAASTKGWEKLQVQQPAMASYRKDGVRLNFYLSTGTLGSALDHPRQGKTQLFRRNIRDVEEAATFFDNPRRHTGQGYRKRKPRYRKNRARYQKRKAKDPPGQGVP
jgi:hypothetical protein